MPTADQAVLTLTTAVTVSRASTAKIAATPSTAIHLTSTTTAIKSSKLHAYSVQVSHATLGMSNCSFGSRRRTVRWINLQTMTYRYEYNSMPKKVSIRCPECRQDATYDSHLKELTCINCCTQRCHALSWPEEANYAVDVRGNRLWAYDREQALDLRNFLESTDRNQGRFKASVFLDNIPTNFLTAKVRDEAVRKLDSLLQTT